MMMEYTVVPSHMNTYDVSEYAVDKIFRNAKGAKKFIKQIELDNPEYKDKFKVICRQVTRWYDYNPPVF